jgi:hypothetical protein
MTVGENLKDFLNELSEQEMIICNKERFLKSLNLKTKGLGGKLRDLLISALSGSLSFEVVKDLVLANTGILTKFLIMVGLASNPLTYPLLGLATGATLGYIVSKRLDDLDELTVKKTPKYINAPLDLVASSWIDILSTILVKILTVDKNYLTEKEKDFLINLFEEKYGYCRNFLESYFKARELSIDEIRKFDYGFISETLKKLSKEEKNLKLDDVVLTIIGEVKAAIELDGQITDRELEEFQKLSRSLSRR